jgi:hypothetical protein
MSTLEYFAVITGIATLTGFAIQLFGLFPDWKRLRTEIVFLSLGLFIGSLASSLSSSTIQLSVPITPMQILIGGVAIVTAVLVLSARFQVKEPHRQETYAVSLGGVVVLLVLLSAYGLANYGPEREPTMSLDEYLLVANAASSRGNYDRAIELLERAQRSMEQSDERKKRLADRLVELRQRQVQ